MSAAEPPAPFSVAVVAAPRFDPPGLEDYLSRLLLNLTVRHRHRPICAVSVLGEPVAQALAEVCRRHGWHAHYAVAHSEERRELAVLRESVAIVATAGAAVILAGERVPEEARRMVWLAEWLRVPHRLVKVPTSTHIPTHKTALVQQHRPESA